MAVYALDFHSGDSEYGSNGDLVSLSGHQQLAFSFWINADTVTGTHVIAVGGASGARAWELWYSSTGALSFYIFDSSANWVRVYSSASAVEAATWKHIVVGIDCDNSANDVLYVNNTDDGTSSSSGFSGTADSRSGTWYVAQYGNSSLYIDAKLDELAIFNKIPSTTEISDWYASGNGIQIPLDTSNLLAVYRFDDGTGTTAVDSKNAYNLTLTNNPSWVTGHVPAGAAGARRFYSPGIWRTV